MSPLESKPSLVHIQSKTITRDSKGNWKKRLWKQQPKKVLEGNQLSKIELTRPCKLKHCSSARTSTSLRNASTRTITPSDNEDNAVDSSPNIITSISKSTSSIMKSKFHKLEMATYHRGLSFAEKLKSEGGVLYFHSSNPEKLPWMRNAFCCRNFIHRIVVIMFAIGRLLLHFFSLKKW